MAKYGGVLLISISALCIGVMVYVLDRQPSSIYFLPEWLSLHSDTNNYLGSIGNYLPTFIHVYVFILLTAVVYDPFNKRLTGICAFWFLLDSLFEICQINLIAQSIAILIPVWISNVPILDNTANYFLMGAFDVLDLFSIALGTVTAYLTIKFVMGRT